MKVGECLVKWLQSAYINLVVRIYELNTSSMKSIPYYSLTAEQKSNFISFLIEASLEKEQPAHTNMYDNDWQNKPNTLLHILEYTTRFKDKGFFHVIFDNDKVVACGGAYASEFSNDVAILGTRTWIHKDYRHKLITRDYLLPEEKSWAIENKFKMIILTFNEYNKNLRKLWDRQRLGENRPERTEKHFGYNNVHIVDYPVNIQYTKQYVLCEKLDNSYDFDWSTIKWI